MFVDSVVSHWSRKAEQVHHGGSNVSPETRWSGASERDTRSYLMDDYWLSGRCSRDATKALFLLTRCRPDPVMTKNTTFVLSICFALGSLMLLMNSIFLRFVSCNRFFFWASCWNYCLTAQDLGTGVEQPFNCLIVQHHQAMQSIGSTTD